MSDHRDLALEMLADEEVVLRERVLFLEANALIQRELTCTAINALAVAIKERDSARRRLRELLAERGMPRVKSGSSLAVAARSAA